LEILYTPWRYEYMSTVDEREGCIFCEKAGADNDRENLIVARDKLCFAILNLYPYSSGHVMVAPYTHLPSIEDLDEETIACMMSLAKRCMAAIRDAFSPEGFNLGINIQRCAGAGIVDHVHMHVVPRWAGDSNFMSVVGDTRILPVTLDEVWLSLSERLNLGTDPLS
jgi:ATP adenylyltransferase